MILKTEGLDDAVIELLDIKAKPADLSDWQKVVDAQFSPKQQIKIAIVGKYTELSDAYKSINESLMHAGISTLTKVELVYLDADRITQEGTDLLKDVQGILIPGGFGHRGIEGKIKAIQYARENQIPFFGICLGMQTAVIEFARNVVGLHDANSTEFDKNTPYPVIGLIQEWRNAEGHLELRDEQANLGGTMRLGAYYCEVQPKTLAQKIYQKDKIVERHRHRYEVNENFVKDLEKHGLVVSGRAADSTLVEMVELPSHPFFIACQFHPEFISTPRNPHPIFVNFVKAAAKL